jgi:D-arabinan exo alpha-(1,3)/(1,5)-arabinofuranosidase (non-reducing end)
VPYRQHVSDPIHFRDRIRVSIEHGHANQLSDDWASTAYWYQDLPSPPASILPVGRRLPNRPTNSGRVPPRPGPTAAADEVAAQLAAYETRSVSYMERLATRTAGRAARSRAFEQGNLDAARVDGSALIAYVNDVAVSTRAYDRPTGEWGVVVAEGTAQVESASIGRLE